MEISFTAKRLEGNNKCCDACFEIGKVTEVKIPVTRYHNGKDLSVKYHTYWLCDDCKRNLVTVLNDCNQTDG